MPARFFFYIRKLHFLLYKKPPAGCALRRTMMMSQATAAGARMCQGTFFVLLSSKERLRIYEEPCVSCRKIVRWDYLSEM